MVLICRAYCSIFSFTMGLTAVSSLEGKFSLKVFVQNKNWKKTQYSCYNNFLYHNFSFYKMMVYLRISTDATFDPSFVFSIASLFSTENKRILGSTYFFFLLFVPWFLQFYKLILRYGNGSINFSTGVIIVLGRVFCFGVFSVLAGAGCC